MDNNIFFLPDLWRGEEGRKAAASSWMNLLNIRTCHSSDSKLYYTNPSAHHTDPLARKGGRVGDVATKLLSQSRGDSGRRMLAGATPAEMG